MHLDIQKNNKEIKTPKLEHKCEKIKKILKYLSGTGVAGFIFAIAAKLIYDKIHQNNHQNKIYKELIINDVTLSIADQIWIDKNMILFAWEYPLCWHDNFMQFLACPDIRCESYDSDDLIFMINWINEKLIEKYNDSGLNRKVKVPMHIRRAPNLSLNPRFENLKNPNECLKKLKSCPSLLSHNYLNNCNFSGKSVIDFFSANCNVIQAQNYDPIESFEDDVNDEYFLDENGVKCNRYILEFNRLPKKDKNGKIIQEYQPFFNNKNIFFMSKYGYYPTFISISDTVIYKSEHHIHGCYIVYDEKKNPKFFIWGNGIKSGLEILSVQESLEKLKKFEIIDVVYSNSEIIEKYYIPELMYNAN